MVQGSARAKLANTNKPADPPPLPEADQADMEAFLEQMRIVLPVVGRDIFKKLPQPVATQAASASPTTSPTGPVFVIDTKSEGDRLAVHARAQLIDGDFIVREGSTARTQQGGQNSYASHREELIVTGALATDLQIPDLMHFTTVVPFASPSAAAAMVLNRNSNGRVEWRAERTGMTYADWQASLVD